MWHVFVYVQYSFVKLPLDKTVPLLIDYINIIITLKVCFVLTISDVLHAHKRDITTIPFWYS